MNQIAAINREANKRALIAAYEAYQRQEPASVDNLMMVVRDFLVTKLEMLDHDFNESAVQAEDRAQDALMDIWSRLRLHQFTGDGEDFFRWVNRISFTARMDGLRELIDERKNKVKLMLPDESDTEDEYENPILTEGQVINDAPFTIPNHVQGVDLSICRLILGGKSYADIAAILEITEQAVKDRLGRVRKKNEMEGRTLRNPCGGNNNCER